MAKRPSAFIFFVLILLAVLISALCWATAFVPTSAFAQANFQTTAKAAVVMEKSSGRVLFEHNSHTPLPMASTTKIATALTVLDNCPDIDTPLPIPAQACGVEGSSVYLREGEHLTVRELLYALMLRSGNDSAVALALTVAGSVENFANLMNQTAQKLGCTNTHFTNPHGLHNDDHYTSAHDLAVITCAALNNPVFAQIVSTKSVKISNEGREYKRILVNKNKLLSTLQIADGVKTGYTKKAGRCFVGSATQNGMQVVAVVLNCAPMFEETSAMLQTAFANYTLQCAIPQNKLCGVIYRKGKPTYYYCKTPFYYPVTQGEKLSLTTTLTDQLQQIFVTLEGKTLFTSPLEAVQ